MPDWIYKNHCSCAINALITPNELNKPSIAATNINAQHCCYIWHQTSTLQFKNKLNWFLKSLKDIIHPDVNIGGKDSAALYWNILHC